MKRPLPPPIQSSQITDKDGQPSSHHYRWMDGLNQSVLDTQDTLETTNTDLTNLTTTVNTNNTSLGNRITTLENLKLTSGTAKTFVSGGTDKFWDFSVPSGVKRINFTASNVAVSASINFGIQLGTAAGIENSGYSSSILGVSSAANVSPGGSSTYFSFTNAVLPPASGCMVISNLTGNTWTCSGNSFSFGSPTYSWQFTGVKTLANTLTTVRLMTSSGTANLIGGTINILYE